MKTRKWILGCIVSVILASCGTSSTVPIVGRKQNLLVTDEQVLSLSNEQYQSYMKSAKVSTSVTNTNMVKRVGQRIASAVISYLNTNGYGNEVSQYQWEFNLVQDQNVNAFCMPGGKIVVFEGLLPVTQDEASLAIVVGHEVAHAVAKHSAERISNEVRKQYGSQILGSVLSSSGVDASWQQIGATVFSLGSQFGAAAYSRKQENEADHLGLIFAAMAGYNPEVAVNFWQRMAASTSGSYMLLSDHPSDETRIKNIQGWMPEALKYYNGGSTVTAPTTASGLKSSSSSSTQSMPTFHISTKKK